MNKSIVIFLAVCLISVHAFVKRDTENANQVDTLSKQVQEFAENINKQLGSAFDPDNIKKNFNDAIDSIKKAVAFANNKDAVSANSLGPSNMQVGAADESKNQIPSLEAASAEGNQPKDPKKLKKKRKLPKLPIILIPWRPRNPKKPKVPEVPKEPTDPKVVWN